MTAGGAVVEFPPHTRGWTESDYIFSAIGDVSPAHAGMDLGCATTSTPSLRFPRTRGDGPPVGKGIQKVKEFPPHTRGWTGAEHAQPVRRAVSPAHAGMDLVRGRRTMERRGFPRTRGDGPWRATVDNLLPQFPPHTRGWTRKGKGLAEIIDVSPAHAGMDRGHGTSFSTDSSFPRTRGDGPGLEQPVDNIGKFPPHTRGWTSYGGITTSAIRVSPAHAGMDRCRPTPNARRGCFPRTRGDGPLWLPVIETPTSFPPHTRGWTEHNAGPHVQEAVSPAHAGMDRFRRLSMRRDNGFPRTRGDGPSGGMSMATGLVFPPHTRGWTGGGCTQIYSDIVSPAHAGMDLGRSSTTGRCRCFPRTRGDGPVMKAIAKAIDEFPPHTRGWTHERVPASLRHVVSPAHAGMDWRWSSGCKTSSCFPRTRGDGPFTLQGLCYFVKFPPHTRGWTAGGGHEAAPARVSPAHAGMDL